MFMIPLEDFKGSVNRHAPKEIKLKSKPWLSDVID